MPASEKVGVIIRVSSAESDVQEAALRSAANLLFAGQPAPPPVEVVLHGPAVGVCCPGHSLNFLVEELLAAGVAVAACERALSRLGVDRAQLTPGVTTAPPCKQGELCRSGRYSKGYCRWRP